MHCFILISKKLFRFHIYLECHAQLFIKKIRIKYIFYMVDGIFIYRNDKKNCQPDRNKIFEINVDRGCYVIEFLL